jgi:hypothetical protein
MINEVTKDIKHLRNIPNDIVINHIIPYTYQIQPSELLLDIVSFQKDFDLIDNLYAFDYNYHILLKDLFCFFNHKKIRTKTKIKITIKSKVKIIWGLLNVYERTRFINNYCIDDD